MPLRTTTPTLNSRVILRQFFDVPPVASSFPPMVERLGSTSNFPMGIFADAKNDPIIIKSMETFTIFSTGICLKVDGGCRQVLFGWNFIGLVTILLGGKC